MRVLILGAGGLGSVLGGYLANTGVDVTLVGRPAHTEAITRDGLRITGRRGDLVITDNLTAVDQTAKASGHFDYLVLAVKGKDTAQAGIKVEVKVAVQGYGLHPQIIALGVGPFQGHPATLVAPTGRHDDGQFDPQPGDLF